MEIQPTKMISIMSIPGGLTISHWEPTVPNPSDSISNPPSMLASQSLLQNTQSFHSRNLSEYAGSPGTQAVRSGQSLTSPSTRTQVGSPGESFILSPSGKIQAGSPEQSFIVSPDGRIQASSPGQGFILSPSVRTQSVSPGQTIIVSPKERTQNPHLYVPTTYVQSLGVSTSPRDGSTTDRFHSEQSRNHTEDRAPGTTTPKYLSPPQQQIHSPKHSPTTGLSPRAKVMSPVLCAIPEITNGTSLGLIQSETSGTNNPTDYDTEKWTNHPPNDSHLYLTHRSESGGLSALASMQGSPRPGAQSDTSLSAKESDSASSQKEIDVFKHLFDDQHDHIA
jgi:hypothetical protein